ncbi:MAG TPA: D-alanine--D-alanine ligase [Candidatus Dormibacteraeota bacterium]|nr:D-alanine--D-alanine ligase [Candidatus Dormibacteraeota bacterium]
MSAARPAARAARSAPGATITARGGAAALPVVVLFGGPSAEHEVSLVSGRAVAAALAERGHPVEAWLITLDGAWWRLPPAAADPARPLGDYAAPAAMGGEGPFSAARALETLAARGPRPTVWIALHGPFGEDGTVQALCEAAGLAYTGSGVAASALGMDKALFKRLTGGLGMPVVPWQAVAASDFAADPSAVARALEAFAAALPDPRLMIKPARLGSSVGMCIVQRPDEPPELEEALRGAFAYDDLALAEAYLASPRELEVAVLGNRAAELEVFGPGEIFPGHEFYDYHAKYDPGVSRTSVAPDVTERLRASVRALAEAAFLAIGASGFARVDFLVHGGRVYLSEINTIPGFTPISLFPALCATGGHAFGSLAARILELALERDAARPHAPLTREALP